MIDAMKQWLEALETVWYHVGTFAPTDDAIELYNQAKTSLHQAIAEAEKQEPVGYRYWNEHNKCFFFCDSPEPVDGSVYEPLYTTPQPRKPLTDERLELIGHADLAINNIHIFNGYGEDVPEGRTPIYAGYKTAHDIKD